MRPTPILHNEVLFLSRILQPVSGGWRPRSMKPMSIRSRRRRWLPVLGAAAVATATVTAALLTTATPATAATGIPAFYMTISGGSQQQLQVHRTADGGTISAVSAVSGGRMVAISAAANDRTFFVAVQTATGTCPADRFVEFGVTGSGKLTGPHPVGGRATGMVQAFAASPAGTKIAYTTVCTTLASPEPNWVLHVMNLASGAVSTWATSATARGYAAVSQGGEVAWTGNGRSLSFAYQWQPAQVNYEDQAVVLVNPDGGGGTLQAHSRLIWHQDNRCAASACVFNALISPEGTSLLAEALGRSNVPGGMTFTLEHIALPAGRVTAVLYRTTALSPGAGIPEPPAWVDSSGTYWLVYVGTKFGWVSQGQLHHLGASSLEVAAW
jgi:hypothetical protein